MATCKDCLHQCYTENLTEEPCNFFLDKAKYEPVKHGRWINKTKNIKGLCDYRFDCSACEHIFWSAGIESFNYCPNCGAKMDLEVTNGLDQH